MLFDKRCTEAVKHFTDYDNSYREFARACTLANSGDDVQVRYSAGDMETFMTIPHEEWQQAAAAHQKALSRDGMYSFHKYAVYTLLYERNRLKHFFNFVTSKGYQRVYNTN